MLEWEEKIMLIEIICTVIYLIHVDISILFELIKSIVLKVI